MLCGQHEIEIIINCLFLSHPSISGFRSSLCAVVLDGPRRFSLIWYLALLSWLSIVWFFGTVAGYLRGNSVQIYSHDSCTHVRIENFACALCRSGISALRTRLAILQQTSGQMARGNTNKRARKEN